MSITDELRELADVSRIIGRSASKTVSEIIEIADRIDEKHYDVQADAYDNGANYVFNNPTLFGLMQLPKDADGQYIHIGDMMECEKLPNGKRVCGKVKAIGNGCVWLANVQYKIHAEYLHHHEPTVEDVLDEFVSAYDRIGGEDEEHQKYLDLIAEYAAKLQLRGDGE